MDTIIERVNPVNPEREKIARAASLIKSGGLVAFPTETVYGLGGNALDEGACASIFKAKGRKQDNPLIVHIADAAQLEGIARDVDIGIARSLQILWPGPITLVLKRDPSFPDFSAKNLDTVAVRMPAHPVALALIRESGVPIAAPSANRSGRPSPTTAHDVIEELGGSVGMILDGGETAFGIESTVIDATARPLMLLRPGAFTTEELSAHIGELVIPSRTDSGAPRAPGMKYRHYAPSKPLALADAGMIKDIVQRGDKRIAILCSDELAGALPDYPSIIHLGSRSSLYTIAKSLFGSFRKLERSGSKIGIIEEFQERGIGLAIMNRMDKAANHTRITKMSQLDQILESL